LRPRLRLGVGLRQLWKRR